MTKTPCKWIRGGGLPMLSKTIDEELDHGGLLLSHELFHLPNK
jgi:hypothetical protein